MLVARVSLVSALAFVTACSGSSEPSVTPEPIDALVLHDSYGALFLAVFTAMRTGDLATAQASIATPGQVETLCPGYVYPITPYTPTSLPDAADHCAEVFAPIDPATLDAALSSHEYGTHHEPSLDEGFETHWKSRCPSVSMYVLPRIFEVHAEGSPQAGVEINGVFTHAGRWGLMGIPRCRGEAE